MVDVEQIEEVDLEQTEAVDVEQTQEVEASRTLTLTLTLTRSHCNLEASKRNDHRKARAQARHKRNGRCYNHDGLP